MKLDKNKILFILILFLAIGVRIVSWPTAISQVNVDEAMTAINAKSIAESGVDIYGTSFPVYLEAWGTMGQSVMLMYLMAFFIKLFGFSMVTVRLPMLIISIISIIVFYFLVKNIFKNTKVALFAMAFVSICPWHLLQSIWSIDCNMFPHFMLISVYLLYSGIYKKKWLLYLSMIFFALTMYTYGVSIYIVPLFLLICAIYLVRKKQVTIKNIIICVIIYLLFSSPILAMYVINALKIETNINIGPITIQYFNANARTSDMLFFSQNFFQTLWQNFKSLLTTFFVQYDKLEWNGIKMFGTIYHISLMFFIVGILYYIAYKNEHNTGMTFMGIWLILSFILGLIINKVNINRINIIWFPTLFFSFYGIYVIAKFKKFFKYLFITVYSILFISFTGYLYTYYTSVIDNSWCFSAKLIDAVHYSTVNLEKHTVCYCDSSGIDVYVIFQNSLDNSTSERINDKMVFANRLINKKDNEAFIIQEEFLKDININLENYKYEVFGNNYIIY